MASNSKIEWTDCTYQIVTGCTKISPGCENCYAEKMSKRLANNHALPLETRRAYAKAIIDWDRHHTSPEWSGVITPIPGAIDRMYDELSRAKKPRRVFAQSMGDLFHNVVDFDLQNAMWEMAEDLDRHIFMFLTKRSQNMKAWADYNSKITLYQPKNIWPGVTVCTQAEADEKIPILLNTPAAIRYVSVEPMLGAIDFVEALNGYPVIVNEQYCSHEMAMDAGISSMEGALLNQEWEQTCHPLDWVICGAETGPGARPMDLAWARSLRDQCRAAGVPFFFKSAGPGKDIPEDLMIREFPK